MQNNILVAVTGGIGSGKSTALKIIEKWGYKSFNADLIYKELLLNEDFVEKVSASFGVKPSLLEGKKTLDREAIREIVFNDKSQLERLNSITHPLIMDEMIRKAKEYGGLVFCEVPLLFEGKFERLFDYIFVIKRQDEQRISSVVKRDGKTEEQIKNIFKNQYDYTKITQNEHTFIIENDGDESALTEKIKFAVEKIK